jgi:hypothetical protein
MSLRTRRALPLLVAGALLFGAAPASADDDDRRHRGRHHKHYSHKYSGHGGHPGNHWKHHGRHHGRGHGHRHHHGCGHGYGHGEYYYAPRVVVEHAYGYPVHHYGAPDVYFCNPCSYYFDSYDLLYSHVHHHHHIAAIQLPSLIFQASIGGGFGWVFGH